MGCVRGSSPAHSAHRRGRVRVFVLVLSCRKLVLKLVSDRGDFLLNVSRQFLEVSRYGQPLSPAKWAVVGGPRKRTAFTLLSSRKGSALCEEAGPFVRLSAATAAPQIPVSQ